VRLVVYGLGLGFSVQFCWVGGGTTVQDGRDDQRNGELGSSEIFANL
jgi:hypothetical protein